MNHANTTNQRIALLFIGGATLLAAPPALAQQPPPPEPTKRETPGTVYQQGSSHSEEPPADVPPPASSGKHYSPAMMVAGIVLTSIGFASLPIGAAMVAIPSKGDFPTGPVAAIGVFGIGAIFPLIGAPLWAVGGHTPAVPRVAAGPRGVSLRWTF